MPIRLRAVSAALALVALACVQDPVIPKLGDDPIVLTMRFSTTTFRIGKADTIDVTATSTFSAPATITFATNCQILVTIRTVGGTPVVPPNGQPTCLPTPSQLVVPANGAVTQRFIWNGAVQFLPTGSTTFLPPGSYFVSAAINATNYSTFAPAVRVELQAP